MTKAAAPTAEVKLPKRRLGLRLRLFGWTLGLLALAVVVSLLVVHQVLVNQVNNQINEHLRHETSAFRSLVDSSDPATGQPFGGDIAAMADTYLVHHAPYPNEAVLVFVDGRVHRSSAHPPHDLRSDAALVSHWVGATEVEYGKTDHTPAGPARWLVTPIVVDEQIRGHFVVVMFTPEQEAQVNAAVRWMAVTCLLVLALTASGGYLAMGRALRPLRVVTETAHQIEDTDLSRRIDVTGSDEVADLAATFNGMLNRLERAFAAERAFLSDAGHELRTPITIVRGHLEVMGNDPLEQTETIALVFDELGRMSRLVDDLLLLASSEQPDFLQLQTLDAATLLREVHAKAGALADRRWQLGPTPAVEVWGDRHRLTQALMQLAHNAAQHTEPGDTIRFSATAAAGKVSLCVEDTGPGIAPADQERIFQRFVRVDGAKRSEGTGLGLAIVKAIAEAHHGTVIVDSTPGSGATFILTLRTAGAQ